MRSTLTTAVLLTFAAIAASQRTASPRSNILERARGTAVISVSSSYGGNWTAANLADGSTSTGWSSAQGAAFPHTVLFELPQPHAIVSIAVDNTGDQEGSYPGISSRRVTVYGSTTSAAAGFTQLTAFEARRGGRTEAKLGAPLTARWLKFVVSSNWGNAEFTEIMELEAYGEPVGPPPMVATGGALRVMNFAFLQAQDGPERTPGPFKVGDRVFTRWQIVGFATDPDGQFHLLYSANTLDPNGLPLGAPMKDDFHQHLAVGVAPTIQFWFDLLPRYAPPGTYTVWVKIHDAVKNADAEFEQRFIVEGPKPEVFTRFDVRDFRFSLAKDGPAEPHPALQRGGTIYLAFRIGGMAFRGDRPDVHIAVRLVGPGGNVLEQNPEWLTIDQANAYHPATSFVGASDWVAIPSDFAPGTYVLKYTLVDRIANHTVNYEAAFEVR